MNSYRHMVMPWKIYHEKCSQSPHWHKHRETQYARGRNEKVREQRGDASLAAPCPPAGEGGNDLLGSRKQNCDQKLERGNLALVGNIAVSSCMGPGLGACAASAGPL